MQGIVERMDWMDPSINNDARDGALVRGKFAALITSSMFRAEHFVAKDESDNKDGKDENVPRGTSCRWVGLAVVVRRPALSAVVERS